MFENLMKQYFFNYRRTLQGTFSSVCFYIEMASVIYFFCLLAVATSTPRDPGQLKSENETF
jgi:hypothetical protein